MRYTPPLLPLIQPGVTRRDFLKLLATLPVTYFNPRIQADGSKQNVLILVFDAFSALNNSIYDYSRQTMPNLSRFLDRATVFHQHYANGTFTTTGTGSLLTGTFPWTHRALNLGHGVVPRFAEHNIFKAFSEGGYHGLAYTHNIMADVFLKQFENSISQHIPNIEFYLDKQFPELLFGPDVDSAQLSAEQILTDESNAVNSLFLSRPYQEMLHIQHKVLLERYKETFPERIPKSPQNRYFLIETVVDWLKANLEKQASPFIGYFHFFPPHDPYITRGEFVDKFDNDDFQSMEKPEHLFTSGGYKIQDLVRRDYDKSICYVDAEFGRFLDFFMNSELKDNTWLVFTSDHGEIFERGIIGHITETFFEPITRVPLVIFEPGQQQRRDVYQATNAVDLLPTLLHLTGQPAPDWGDGYILPPYNPTPVPEDRAICSLYARQNARYQPLTTASAMLLRWPYKLSAYWGYEALGGERMYELFNIAEDPNELVNLYDKAPNVAQPMIEELRQRIDEADEPYK